MTTSLQTDSLEPVTQADMDYSIGSDVLETCQNYRKVCSLGSPDPSMCRATGKGLEEPIVGEKCSAVLQAVNLKGQPLKVPIRSSECELDYNLSGSEYSHSESTLDHEESRRHFIASVTWTCDYCTFLNAATETSCEVCNMRR